MKQPLLAFALVVCGSCAPPGYMYDTGSFTPRPIDRPQPPVFHTDPITEAKQAENHDEEVAGIAARQRILYRCDPVIRAKYDPRIEYLRSALTRNYSLQAESPQAFAARNDTFRLEQEIEDEEIEACSRR